MIKANIATEDLKFLSFTTCVLWDDKSIPFCSNVELEYSSIYLDESYISRDLKNTNIKRDKLHHLPKVVIYETTLQSKLARFFGLK